jgi:alkanesulfonate monooxygenase SsuD/methylene tetrahydromethanopterin reductase-like flavin-dependent oxidoreductase (luciferase family)
VSLFVGFGLVTAQVPPTARHNVADEYADALEQAVLAEDLGFDSYWVSEHHLAQDSYLPSPLVLLAAVAALTSRIMLGTGIVLAPLQDPKRFAEDCAVVDQLSRGRLLLGLGAGWRKAEFEHFGVSVRDRVARTVELVDVCRAAWTGAVTPAPARPIPIFLGGTASAAIARAGALGDGYIGSPGNDLERFVQQVGVFDDAARSAGRDPSMLPLATHVNAWVSKDGAIPTSVKHAMWHQIGTYQEWHAHDDGIATGGQLPPYDEDALRARTIFGAPDDVVDQVRPWISRFAGRDIHVIFRLHYPGMRTADAAPAIRLFAQHVIPQLRLHAQDGARVPLSGTSGSTNSAEKGRK